LGDFFDPIQAGIFHAKPLDLMILPKKSTFNRLKAKGKRQNPQEWACPPFNFAPDWLFLAGNLRRDSLKSSSSWRALRIRSGEPCQPLGDFTRLTP